MRKDTPARRQLPALLLVLLSALAWQDGASAAGTQYELRVDGLACPYCAYGIEKKLRRTQGVQQIDIDIDRGVVQVGMAEGKTLSKPQMEQLVKDAGFTLRGMKERPQ